MPYDKVEFTLGADQLAFSTQTNGDKLGIIGIDLDPEQAAAMAYLINQTEPLIIKIEVQP